MTLRVVADENMPNVDAWFAPISSTIVRKPGRSLTSSDLHDADILLVRSVTQVNEALLAGTNIKFVGSATIGTDHVDQSYLKQQKIPFRYAPGCNAQSVADWLLSVLSRLHLDADLDWWNKTIAIVGVGNVGSKVVASLNRFGCNLLVCDPIKHEQGLLPDNRDLNTVLKSADIVCFHTPHTRTGDYPTHGLLDADRLSLMKPGAWLINAGRGPVFQYQPLVEAARAGSVNLVLDVWPNEPSVEQELLDHVHLASPHVAGYSLEGKYKGTEMLAQAVSSEFHLNLAAQVAPPKIAPIDAQLYHQEDVRRWASELVLHVYDPARDTVALRASAQNGVVSAATFDELRKHYPERRELASVPVINVDSELEVWLARFGFVCR